MANLMFAASRCGELPELHLLRCIFRERYGCEFETANVELRHENLVSSQMKQNLCLNVVVPDDEKLKLIREISGEGEHTLRLGFRDSEQSSKMHCQEVGWQHGTSFYLIANSHRTHNNESGKQIDGKC